MGGRNAIVVMADADVDAAVDAIVLAGFGTTGQRCTSSSRVIAERAIAGELVDRVVARSRALTVGPGLDPATDVGPLVSERQLDEVIGSLERAVDEGAEVLAGGERLQDGACRHGHFMRPAVARVPAESWFAGHEVFGPVVSVFEAADFDHAVRLNNSVEYGLSSAIFTRSLEAAMRFVSETDTGMVYVNRPTTGAEPHIPFGGAKSSSIGPPEMGSAWQFYTRSRSAHVHWGQRSRRSA
jgi:aldehyde dehydrogenase (NAD+)